MANIGQSNYAAYHGVPETTVGWTGRSGTSRSGTIFTSANGEPMSDRSDTRDNQNEIRAIRDINDRIQFTLAVKPVAANAAAALAIMGDLPKIGSILTLSPDAAETDMAATGTIIIDSASKAYTPDGEGIINFTVTKHIGKTFAALS